MAPIPIRQRLPIVQPWITAEWPMVTWSPITVGWVLRITWTRVKSWTLDRAPMRMELTSPRTTTFIHRLLSGPTCTSPITWALTST